MSDLTYYFYDLETSSVNPRTGRIMQFAGQRTDLNLQPLGDPDNILIKLHEDILPEPDAILVTGITPQMTLADGISEAEFFKYFTENIATANTVFCGFNNVRFDDEFMRFGLYRNFYDPYEWQWKSGSSRWDLLDVVRMTRALRPEGIQWPFASDGKPTNRLELLTELNGLEHDNAHDALNDVYATIHVASMIQKKQPKLYDYLFRMRGKKEVEAFLASSQIFVYASGKYDSAYEKLTIVASLGKHPQNNGQMVYDLRFDPSKYLTMEPQELAEIMKYTKDPEADRLPVKTLQYNRCPAIAPISVLTPTDQDRLQIDIDRARSYQKLISEHPDFNRNVSEAYKLLNKDRTQTAMVPNEFTAETELYEAFLADKDKRLYDEIHNSDPKNLNSFASELQDNRLKAMLPLYKARNFSKSLDDGEREQWEIFKSKRIQDVLPHYFERLQQLSGRSGATERDHYILEELRLYAESIVSLDDI